MLGSHYIICSISKNIILSTELLYDLQLSLYIHLLIKFCLGDKCNSSFLLEIWPSSVANSFLDCDALLEP